MSPSGMPGVLITLTKLLRLLTLLTLLLVSAAAAVTAAEPFVPAIATLDSNDLKPGMKGYGLTVFEGTKVERFDVEIKDAVKGEALGKVVHKGPLKLIAPMPGKIVKVLVQEGEAVEAGRGVLVMEAMKMENELKASKAGTVREIKVKEGQAVEMGALLLVIS